MFWMFVSNKQYNRFWEIDFLRGIAIVMMVIYHILFDLNFFDVYSINLHSIPFRLFLYPIGTTFLLLVGISLTLSYERAKGKISEKKLLIKFLFRGLEIFGFGIIITIITWILIPEKFIIFGVLHCIGISIILAYPFLQIRIPNLLIGIVFVILGIDLRTMVFDFNFLVWLGFVPSEFSTIDYFPLLPWFGVVLIGIFIGKTLYPNHARKFELPDLSRYKSINFFCFLGKHSLVIYLIHQPILLGIIYLFSPLCL